MNLNKSLLKKLLTVSLALATAASLHAAPKKRARGADDDKAAAAMAAAAGGGGGGGVTDSDGGGAAAAAADDGVRGTKRSAYSVAGGAVEKRKCERGAAGDGGAAAAARDARAKGRANQRSAVEVAAYHRELIEEFQEEAAMGFPLVNEAALLGFNLQRLSGLQVNLLNAEALGRIPTAIVRAILDAYTVALKKLYIEYGCGTPERLLFAIAERGYSLSVPAAGVAAGLPRHSSAGATAGGGGGDGGAAAADAAAVAAAAVAPRRVVDLSVVMRLLRIAGAAVNARDLAGWTPLHEAALSGHAEVAQLLLEAGADVMAANVYGRTTVHAVAMYSSTEVLRMLLAVLPDGAARRAAVNIRDQDDWTPLHWAAYYGRTEVIAELVAAGAAVKAVDRGGWTPLHGAACRGNAEVCRVLLAVGADKNLPDKRGSTAADLARAYGHAAVALLIEEYRPADGGASAAAAAAAAGGGQ